MPKLKYLIFIICLFFNSNAFAGVVEDLERHIASDRNISLVTVTLQKAPQNMNSAQKIDGIKGIQYSLKNPKHFTAEVLISGRPNTVEGKYEVASLIPAFKNYVRKGHIIDYSDLITVKVPNKRINQSYFEKNEDLIGKTAKRKLPPNMPVHSKDVTTPNILDKGTNVKMVFQKSGLSIEAKGVTLEGGSLGDFIKVKNLDSNKIVKARILDEATVTTND